MSKVGPKKRAITVCMAALIVVASGAGLWSWFVAPDPNRLRADPYDARLVALGKTVYHENCAACHGKNLEGQPNWRKRKPDGKLPAPPHDETGHTWHHPDEHLFRVTKLGVKPPVAPKGYQSDMPAFGGVLSDDQIWAVLAYIKSKWPDHIRERRERAHEAHQRQKSN